MRLRESSLISRYHETIRHLRPRQCAYRLLRAIERNVTCISGSVAHSWLRLRGGNRRTSIPHEKSARIRELAYWKMKTKPGAWSSQQPEVWNFLNQPLRLGFPPRWNGSMIYHNARDPRLWHFHLHYFDWIWDLLQDGRDSLAVSMMEHWADRNHIGNARCFHAAWHPYTTSLRIRNWLIALVLLKHRGRVPDKSLEKLSNSLWLQFNHLGRHLEYEHGGNHLIENLITIVFAQAFFASPSNLDPTNARQLLLGELSSQVSRGGCHCEQSPMYQAILLDRLVDLLAVLDADDPMRSPLSKVVSRMNGFLCHILMPDGNYPLLGDSTRSISVKLWSVRARAAHFLGEDLRKPNHGFSQQDGYYVYRDMKRGDYVLLDAAPLGDDSLGAHMHADAFGFELVLGDVAVIADGGAGIYREGSERTELRSAFEHAGLIVNGWACAEPWKSFRMGRRGKVIQHEGRDTGNGMIAEGLHDGFAPARTHHYRRVEFFADSRTLKVTDVLKPTLGLFASGWNVEVRLPLHHALSARQDGDNKWILSTRKGGLPVAEVVIESITPSLRLGKEPGIYYPAFGISLPRTVLRASCRMMPGAEFVYTVRPLS
ncbi:alginate lyase family protein [Candidatus Sumerlaeota bacterium]|nr:alginate lyase family protein [Candidatus Sumerlaeota bacterium]